MEKCAKNTCKYRMNGTVNVFHQRHHRCYPERAIKKCPPKTIPYFNFEVPTELPGVDPAILDPRDTYADASEWETKAKDLADRFIGNFVNEGNAAVLWFPLISK